MRIALGVFTALATIVFSAPAMASNVGTGTTSTGQTLTITIDTPYDGVTVYGTNQASMSGHVSLSPVDGASTTISRIAVGTGDGFEQPGSTYTGEANSWHGDSSWSSFNQITFEGTQTIYATAIAADGTRATATITITLEPKALYPIVALGVLYDWRVGATGALEATMSMSRGPAFGSTLDFYVTGEKVCSATISGPTLPTDTTGYAICRDPAAIAKAIAAGGYEARYGGSQYALPSSASAGVIERQPA